ncbi:MAG: YvcK family protein [Clostridiales bacterium]|nr:YvcK family protein [Clostridiales bacterium]
MDFIKCFRDFILSISISHFFTLMGITTTTSSYIPIGLLGVLFICIGLYQVMKSLFGDTNYFKSPLYNQSINQQIYDKKILSRRPKIVVIGGGTGLSILLRGLKLFTTNITAIVTVADDGGGSGVIREDLGMLPPGDIRNCILGLAEMEPTMEKLFQYRFEDGSLKGQSFGNLFIASMNGITSNFEEAIKRTSEVLAVTGEVYPVTLENITLYARLENDTVIKGESNIPIKSLELNSPIDRVFIKPKEVEGLKGAVKAIEDADIVVLGPGSLYTSIMPNLLVKNIKSALEKSTNKKVYISNIMTQPGETHGYGIKDHVDGILKHCPKIKLDYVIANNGIVQMDAYNKYQEEGAQLVIPKNEDRKYLQKKGIRLIEENFIEVKKNYIRHDAVKVSRVIVDLVAKKPKKYFI